MNRPATSRVGRPGCPGPVWHTELKRPSRKFQSICAANRASGWPRSMISIEAGGSRSFWLSSRGVLIAFPNVDDQLQGNHESLKRRYQNAEARPTTSLSCKIDYLIQTACARLLES